MLILLPYFTISQNAVMTLSLGRPGILSLCGPPLLLPYEGKLPTLTCTITALLATSMIIENSSAKLCELLTIRMLA